MFSQKFQSSNEIKAEKLKVEHEAEMKDNVSDTKNFIERIKKQNPDINPTSLDHYTTIKFMISNIFCNNKDPLNKYECEDVNNMFKIMEHIVEKYELVAAFKQPTEQLIIEQVEDMKKQDLNIQNVTLAKE